MDYRPKKRLGQHFLTSDKIVSRIIDLIGPRADEVILEVGPGRGALTRPLAESGAQIWAIEFDRDLVAYLEREFAASARVTIVHKDFLAFHPEDHHLERFVLVGNLPYNITSPTIDWCVRHRQRIERAVFMVQRELAARVTGAPGSKDWSPLGIFTQLYFNATCCFDVPQHAFTPPPEVVSTVIKLTPWPTVARFDLPSLERVVRASFTQRRKTLLNNVVPSIFPDAQRALAAFDELNLTHSSRAEEVTLAQFIRLSELAPAPKAEGH